MGKIVGITYDLKSDWKFDQSDPSDAHAEFDKPETVERVIKALENAGHVVKRIGNGHSLLSQIDQLDVDIVFNLCEGTSGRNRESQVPVILEMKGIPFVGSDALTLGVTLDKVMAKKLFMAQGIPTARYLEAKSSQHLKLLNDMKFPLMVKTCHEGSSKGISESSRVDDFDSLKRQVDFINQRYHQPALIEEFIRGTEFTVAVLGNENCQAMPVVQVSIDGSVELGEKFYTFERISSDTLQYICPAKISQELTRTLQEWSVKVYQCVDCRDFGRVDFRVDEQGNPYVLEINPLPSMDVRDVFNLFPQTFGSNFDKVINQILYFALDRYGLIDEGDTFLKESKNVMEIFS